MDEEAIIKNKYIKFIFEVSDLKDRRNEERLQPGYLTITKNKILLIPEVNNQPSVEEAKKINLSDVTDVDRKIELWRSRILGATHILPIHHFYEGKEVVSIISTSHENAILFKKTLLVLLVSGCPVEFIFPFSKGGKILLDKQPVNGSIQIDREKIILSSEWLGKKQQVIDIMQVDDFDTEPSGSVSPGRTSITLKYLKDGVLISTLIASDDRTIISLDKYIKLLKGISDDEEITLDEQQFMLVQLMYTSDIDAETAMQTLGVTMEELGKIVADLLKMEIIRSSGDDEFELTEKGTRYIVGQMKKDISRV